MKKLFLSLFFFAIANVVLANDDAPKRYYLIFSARDMKLKPFSIGGHAFVTWAVQQGTDSLHMTQTLGFYPNEKASLTENVLDNLHGHIEQGFTTNSKGLELEQMMVEVDSTTWHRSKVVEKGWRKHSYNLLRSNCVSFIDRVAHIAKLKRVKTVKWNFIPVRPVKYIRKMIKRNRDKIISF